MTYDHATICNISWSICCYSSPYVSICDIRWWCNIWITIHRVMILYINIHTITVCNISWSYVWCLKSIWFLAYCATSQGARLVWGRHKCSPSFLIQSDLCNVHFQYDSWNYIHVRWNDLNRIACMLICRIMYHVVHERLFSFFRNQIYVHIHEYMDHSLLHLESDFCNLKSQSII